MQFLRRDQRKAFREIKPHLMPEDRDRSRPRPVSLANPLPERPADKIMVSLHRANLCFPPHSSAFEQEIDRRLRLYPKRFAPEDSNPFRFSS